jgi:hypothetical protein
MKKWSDFKKKKVKKDKGIEQKFPKKNKIEPLSKDIKNIPVVDIEKLNMKDWYIDQIIDVIPASSLEETGIDFVSESNEIISAGALDVKTGDTLYITALLKNVKDPNPNNCMGVLKVRVVDLYKGLSILNSLKK